MEGLQGVEVGIRIDGVVVVLISLSISPTFPVFGTWFKKDVDMKVGWR